MDAVTLVCILGKDCVRENDVVFWIELVILGPFVSLNSLEREFCVLLEIGFGEPVPGLVLVLGPHIWNVSDNLVLLLVECKEAVENHV